MGTIVELETARTAARSFRPHYASPEGGAQTQSEDGGGVQDLNDPPECRGGERAAVMLTLIPRLVLHVIEDEPPELREAHVLDGCDRGILKEAKTVYG